MYNEAPALAEMVAAGQLPPGHVAACHFADQLTLRGVNDF
jgi:hypothetical protein